MIFYVEVGTAKGDTERRKRIVGVKFNIRGKVLSPLKKGVSYKLIKVNELLHHK